MRGRLLRKLGKKIHKLADKVTDQVTEQVSSHLQNVDWADALDTITDKGKQCAQASRETVEICDATQEKREQMIDFASEIQSTLQNIHEGDASVLETIRDLTDGAKVQEGIELAKGLDRAALACVEKSTLMIDLMEQGMDSLPKVVQDAIERAAGDDDDSDDEEEELLKGLESDMQDVQLCIQSIQELNIATALKVGAEAFSQLTDKAKRSKSLFMSVRGFAADVQEITDAFSECDVSTIMNNAKDMLRCIGLCEEMRQIAEGAGKLLQLLISLFSATADRISALWAALAFAKDCMTDSVELVNQAKTYCLDARDKSTTLITTSRTIYNQLDTIGEWNGQSFRTIRQLAQGGEIQEAIDLARNMDDVVVECSGKVTCMIDRVTQGFDNIPSILTEDMDMRQVGKQDDDPEPLTVEQDVQELEESQKAIEESDIIGAIRAGKQGFSGVADKAAICEKTLGLMDSFAGDCSRTLDSFLSVWDLESASTKIHEMCRLVNLGEIIKQFAQQVKRLLLAIVGLMRAAMAKFSEDFPDVSESVGQVVDSAKDKLDDAVDVVKDKLKDSLTFWK